MTVVFRTKNYNGFQRAMAMKFALDAVNREVAEGKKKIALKGHIYDTCSNDISAIATVLEAIKDVVPAAGGKVTAFSRRNGPFAESER